MNTLLAHTPRLTEDDRHSYFAQIYTSRLGVRGLTSGSSSTLVAELHHVDIEHGEPRGTLPMAELVVRHPTATDVEHDTAKLARIELAAMTLIRMFGTKLIFQAVITSFRAYTPGEDFLSVGDSDTAAGVCDTDSYGPEHQAHPFMAYLPSELPEHRALIGQVVQIELIPEILVDADGQPIS